MQRLTKTLFGLRSGK